jgi:hypothetical protein
VSTDVEVTQLPTCDLCRGNGTPAWADARLPAIGSWAYLCFVHFKMHGCQLGLGKGQRLIISVANPS